MSRLQWHTSRDDHRPERRHHEHRYRSNDYHHSVPYHRRHVDHDYYEDRERRGRWTDHSRSQHSSHFAPHVPSVSNSNWAAAGWQGTTAYFPDPYGDDNAIDRDYAGVHDSEGHFMCTMGDSVGEGIDPRQPSRRRFKLLKQIGEGTFGRVFSCWDRVDERYVALKVVRAIPKYSHAAMIEIEILERIKRVSERQREEQRRREQQGYHETDHKFYDQRSVELICWFKHCAHVCLVFPLYGPSVFDFLKENKFKPFHLHVIRSVGSQILQTLAFLHTEVGLVHTDLKPENILFDSDEHLLRHPPDPRGRSSQSRSRSTSHDSHGSSSRPTHKSPKSPSVRLIDFGSAVYHDDHHGSVICTRNYRPPEVLLRLGWAAPADIWSMGCILLEMYTGNTTFQTHHNIEHLAMLEKSLGPIPLSMIIHPPVAELSRLRTHHSRERDSEGATKFRNSAVAKYFRESTSRGGEVRLHFPQSSSSRHTVNTVNIVDRLDDIVDRRQHPLFYDLVRKMLTHNPAERITAAEASRHPFFTSDRHQN